MAITKLPRKLKKGLKKSILAYPTDPRWKSNEVKILTANTNVRKAKHIPQYRHKGHTVTYHTLGY